jgi:hypothetical protein
MLASRYAGSSKDKGQMRRDAVRGALQERGLLDDNWQGTLADGTTTDFGKDGSVLENRGYGRRLPKVIQQHTSQLYNFPTRLFRRMDSSAIIIAV